MKTLSEIIRFFKSGLKQKGPLSSTGEVSGKVVVFVLFTGAIILFGTVFGIAYRTKLSNQANILAMNQSPYMDSASTPIEIREWMTAISSEWTQITFIEGQGFVRFTPCYETNATLTLHNAPEIIPHVTCDQCDSLGEFSIPRIRRLRLDSTWEFTLDPNSRNASLRLLPLTDSSFAKIQRPVPTDALFGENVLIWSRLTESSKQDTLIFVPTSQSENYESLRAEDENPEGCGSEPAD